MHLKAHHPIPLKHAHLTFELELIAGQACALWGENGSGKSSFFTYLKENQRQLFAGKRVAFLDQKRPQALEHLRGQDLLDFLREILADHFDERRLEHFWQMSPEWREKIKLPMSKLSGGEAQWLKILALFIQRADFYILDEPAQQLDQEKRQQLAAWVEEKKKEGAAFLISDHQQDFLQNHCREFYLFKCDGGQAVIKKVPHFQGHS